MRYFPPRGEHESTILQWCRDVLGPLHCGWDWGTPENGKLLIVIDSRENALMFKLAFSEYFV